MAPNDFLTFNKPLQPNRYRSSRVLFKEILDDEIIVISKDVYYSSHRSKRKLNISDHNVKASSFLQFFLTNSPNYDRKISQFVVRGVNEKLEFFDYNQDLFSAPKDDLNAILLRNKYPYFFVEGENYLVFSMKKGIKLYDSNVFEMLVLCRDLKKDSSQKLIGMNGMYGSGDSQDWAHLPIITDETPNSMGGLDYLLKKTQNYWREEHNTCLSCIIQESNVPNNILNALNYDPKNHAIFESEFFKVFSDVPLTSNHKFWLNIIAKPDLHDYSLNIFDDNVLKDLSNVLKKLSFGIEKVNSKLYFNLIFNSIYKNISRNTHPTIGMGISPRNTFPGSLEQRDYALMTPFKLSTINKGEQNPFNIASELKNLLAVKNF